jgi:hypothetical protein
LRISVCYWISSSIVAQLLPGSGGPPRPRAFTIDPINEECERTVDVAVSHHPSCNRNARTQRHGAGRRGGRLQCGFEIAARLGKNGLAQQIRPRLRHAKADMPAAGMAQQIDRPGVQLSMKPITSAVCCGIR